MWEEEEKGTWGAGFVPRARWDRGGVRGNERPAAMRMALSGRRAQSSREREEVVPDARGCARLSLLRSVAQRPACSGEMKKSLSVFCLPGVCRPVPVHSPPRAAARAVSGVAVAREKFQKSRDVVCLRSARRGPGRGLSTDEPGLHTARRGTADGARRMVRTPPPLRSLAPPPARALSEDLPSVSPPPGSRVRAGLALSPRGSLCAGRTGSYSAPGLLTRRSAEPRACEAPQSPPACWRRPASA